MAIRPGASPAAAAAAGAAAASAAVAAAQTFKYSGTAPPATSGVTYTVGEMCRNTAPIPGGSVGWVCTATGVGSAATWKTWGPVAT